MTWDSAPLDVVRRTIAATLASDDSIDARLGEIELRPHQQRAATRLLAIITKHGGAMLAEPVGVGKTYTALAVAGRCGGPVLVVAPAALRDMWRDAAHRCALPVTITSHETLSRGRLPNGAPKFVIVDEAHRVRTTTTRRYALLADVCRSARVLLVTATPVQNAHSDLASQLALFLGRTAWTMSEERLVDYVVRDSASLLGARPRLDGPYRVALDADDDCLDDLLALPAPIPAKDESIAAALLTYGLLHQWTSSRAALVAALGRRRARGFALIAAIQSGRRPTRAELSAWTHDGDALQLAFPELVAGEAEPDDVDSAVLLAALEQHSAAVEQLIVRLRRAPDPDDHRAAVLRRIREKHAGERIIAFCQYAETVYALGSKLARDARVATLTAAGARVAGGRISRSDVLAQFSPGPDRSTAAERIDLLVTTDLLSEGLNLQEASVIVHLDLPWNPARLDQRVGRALRIGSRHAAVTVYVIAPPASAERLLRIETRLRDKLNVAQRTIGIAGRILPSPLGGALPAQGLAEQRSAFVSRLHTWSTTHDGYTRERTCVAAVSSETSGFLALVRTGDGPLLAADLGSAIETATPVVSRAIDLCVGDSVDVDERRAYAACAALDRWIAARRGAESLNLSLAGAARARRAALTRVAQTLSRAPRHQRSQLASLADAARSVALAPLGEGAERVLEMLVRADLPDEAWLRSLAAFGQMNARPSTAPVVEPEAGLPPVVAVILLQPSRARAASVADQPTDNNDV